MVLKYGTTSLLNHNANGIIFINQVYLNQRHKFMMNIIKTTRILVRMEVATMRPDHLTTLSIAKTFELLSWTADLRPQQQCQHCHFPRNQADQQD